MRHKEIRKIYKMKPHEKEGGWYSVVFDNESGGNIYYLLGPREYSRIHKIKVDEMWHFFEGSPLDLYLFHKNFQMKKIHLSANGCRQYLVPAGQWMGARPEREDGYSFLSCSVWGKFQSIDVRYAEFEEFTSNFTDHKALIRSLIPE